MAKYTGNKAAYGVPVAGVGYGGSLKVAYGSVDLATALAASDTCEFCRLPAGATIVGGWFRGTDLDTGTETLDMDLGWAANGGTGDYDAADPDGLGNLGVLTGDPFSGGNCANVAGYNYPLNGLLLTGVFPTFTQETIIQATVNAPAATFAAGVVSFVVFYAMD